KQLGLDAQIKNALAKAGNPEKPTQTEQTEQVAEPQVPQKVTEGKFLCPEKKIQILRQERIDPNLTSEILQTLPHGEAIRYTHIIEGRFRGYSEKLPEKSLLPDRVEIVLQDPIEGEKNDFLNQIEEVEVQQIDEKVENSQEGDLIEEIEYLVEEEEVICEEAVEEQFPEEFPKEENPIIFLETQENPIVVGISQEILPEELVTEEVPQEDCTKVPPGEEETEILERSFSGSEESFRGFSQTSEVSENSHQEAYLGEQSNSGSSQEISREELSQVEEENKSFNVEEYEEAPKLSARRFRSLSDTIVSIRSRISIHREAEKLAESFRNNPEETDSSSEASDLSESSSEDSSEDSSSSNSSKSSHIEFLLKYVDRERLIKDILEQEKKYLDRMMVEQFVESDFDERDPLEDEEVRSPLRPFQLKQERESQTTDTAHDLNLVSPKSSKTVKDLPTKDQDTSIMSEGSQIQREHKKLTVRDPKTLNQSVEAILQTSDEVKSLSKSPVKREESSERQSTHGKTGSKKKLKFVPKPVSQILEKPRNRSKNSETLIAEPSNSCSESLSSLDRSASEKQACLDPLNTLSENPNIVPEQLEVCKSSKKQKRLNSPTLKSEENPEVACKRRKEVEEEASSSQITSLPIQTSCLQEEASSFVEPEPQCQLETECDSPESELIGFPEESSFLDTSGGSELGDKVITPIHIKPDPDMIGIKMEKQDSTFEKPRMSTRSRRLPARIQNEATESSQGSKTVGKAEKPAPKKPSKGRRKNVEFVITDVSATEEDGADCREAAAKSVEPKDTVTCGRCNLTMPTDSWHKHYLNHNGVAWRVELDFPLDVDDEQVRARIMQTTIKRCRLGFVRCEKCGETRKSGIGLVSHERTCGKTKEDIVNSMVACEYCDRRILPCSLKVHQTNHCKGLKKLQAEAAGEPLPDGPEQEVEPEYSSAGRIKRKSTRVAEVKFQRELSPNDEAFSGSGSEASMGSESSDSDGSSGAVSERSEQSDMFSDIAEYTFKHKGKKKKKKKKKSSKKSHSTSGKPAEESRRGPFTLQNWKQTSEENLMLFYSSNIKQFRAKNHSSLPIFTKWMPQIVVSSADEDFTEYMPKCRRSIYYDQLRVGHYKVSYGGVSSNTLSQLECFEGVIGGRSPPILYCGAPVLSFDWLIDPPEEVDGEILAISCASTFRSTYAYTHTDPEKTIIQIWNVGPLGWGDKYQCSHLPSHGDLFSRIEHRNLLMTGSIDRDIRIYDLTAGGTEISTHNCKSQITSGWSRTESMLKHPFNLPYEDTSLIVHTQDLTDLDAVDLKATKVFRSRHVAEYPLTRINRVAFNPNERASKYYAIGYQAGFVRLCKI
uniref:Uncharacterized protein n=1 Tax=Lutzomyia longipalpis TaxID=7200 RepID=A0A1B0CL86_LUTLO